MELQNLKGVGEKTIELLYEANIYNLNDLIEYYPYRYQFVIPQNLKEADFNKVITINARIVETGKVSYVKKNLNILRFKVIVNDNVISVVIFNRAFLSRNLKVNQDIILTGKYDENKRIFVASNLKFGMLTKTQIIPVYHKIKGIREATFLKIVKEAFNECDFVDYVPSYLQEKYQFISKKQASYQLHFPKTEEEITLARQRLVYEELFVFLFKIQMLKIMKNEGVMVEKNFSKEKIEKFICGLPFKLTKDQLNGINDGLADFALKKRMNRLLLGDVGSGKTIVAVVLMYANFLAGYQSAFMAPTEILAVQHFYSVNNFMKKYDVVVELLVGSMSKKEKDKVLERVLNGEVDILIGTHAILNENLHFKNLGFVITDEQHRFGVKARNNLQEKGVKPDVLFMSATPIPRTYALTLYGDMDTTIIKEKPNGRKEVITKIVKETDLKIVLYHVLKEIKMNHQVYVVAPMIIDNNDSELKNVNLLAEKFKLAFNDKVPIGILHGKLSSKEKDDVMNKFKNGELKILISTTVIEVGVDVKDATTIIIFNAERFGLATLHQLRGRVGRNDLQSYCYLICNNDVKRLQVLEESNDGFYISEKDFEMRGEGDLFGERQSGDMAFRIADIRKDYEILLKAKNDVMEWINKKEYQKVPSFQKIMEQLKFNN